MPGRQALGVPDQQTGASETSTSDEEPQLRAQFHEQHVGGSGRETPSRVPTAWRPRDFATLRLCALAFCRSAASPMRERRRSRMTPHRPPIGTRKTEPIR